LHVAEQGVPPDPIACSGDAQVCPPPHFTCVDSADQANCGACGNACNPLQRCAPGGCTIHDCAPLVNCHGSCVDTQANARHCGQCGRRCTRGQTCVAGECAGGPAYTMALWELCQTAGLADIVGAPPDANLRMDRTTCTACPEGSISNAHGDCEVCPANTTVVGNMCEVCDPAGFVLHEGQCCAFDVDTNRLTVAPEDLGCPVQVVGEASCGVHVLHVSGLDAYTQGGRTGEVVFYVQSPTPGNVCAGTQFEIQLMQNVAGLWTPFATLISTAQDGVIGCQLDLQIAVTDAQINAGLTELVAI